MKTNYEVEKELGKPWNERPLQKLSEIFEREIDEIKQILIIEENAFDDPDSSVCTIEGVKSRISKLRDKRNHNLINEMIGSSTDELNSAFAEDQKNYPWYPWMKKWISLIKTADQAYDALHNWRSFLRMDVQRLNFSEIELFNQKSCEIYDLIMKRAYIFEVDGLEWILEME